MKKRLRLCVYKSSKHIYAQIIDDAQGRTICSASSLKLNTKQLDENGGPDLGANLSRKLRQASQVGKDIAAKAKGLGIIDVYFDRNGYKYHGRVRVLAESARQGGLNF